MSITEQEETKTEREVVIRTTVTHESRMSTERWWYRNLTEKQIIDGEANADIEVVLDDFARNVQSTPAEKLIVVRTIEIVDKA